MRVFVFSKNKQTPLVSRARKAGDGLTIEVYPYEALGRTLPTLAKGSIVYLDVGSLTPREQARRMAMVDDHPELLFGVIDFSGSVDDPAALFHRGIVDYLGKPLAATGLNVERLSALIGYARAIRRETGEAVGEDMLRTAKSWAEIKEGREYPFFLLFIEADYAEEMKERFGQENIAHALDTFRVYVDRGVSPYGGKIWMWSGFGGIVLFPFSPRNCIPIVCALRLLLWRPLFDVEESPLPNYLSFRMALSIGSMVYREKRTGGIVSDALNSVFHLGQRFTDPGRFTLSADVLDMAPDRLKEYCLPAGLFEGQKVFRVRALVYPSVQREDERASEG